MEEQRRDVGFGKSADRGAIVKWIVFEYCLTETDVESPLEQQVTEYGGKVR
jgi:hypothetical protein